MVRDVSSYMRPKWDVATTSDARWDITIVNAFQKILDGSNRKPNKIWVDKRSGFYSRSMKSWLQNNDIEIHSTYSEGKSVVPERFIRNIRNKNVWLQYKKIVYIDKLDDIVNKYSNRYHSAIKMRPVDVKSNIYIDRTSKYKNFIAKGYVPNCSRHVFGIKKVNTLCHGHTLLVILMVKKLLKSFTKNNCKNKSKRV